MSDGCDIDIRSSGHGWTGTFVKLIRTAVADITDDGPYGPVEVTFSDGQTKTGVLDVWVNGDALKIDRLVVDLDDVVRLRA